MAQNIVYKLYAQILSYIVLAYYYLSIIHIYIMYVLCICIVAIATISYIISQLSHNLIFYYLLLSKWDAALITLYI